MRKPFFTRADAIREAVEKYITDMGYMRAAGQTKPALCWFCDRGKHAQCYHGKLEHAYVPDGVAFTCECAQCRAADTEVAPK